MPNVCLIFHLHHPYHPASYEYPSWRSEFQATDGESTMRALVEQSERWLDPMAIMLRKVIEKHPEIGFGLSVSGNLIEQWEHWSYDSLDLWQQVWKSQAVGVLPQPMNMSPEILWDRESWLNDIRAYQEKLSLLGGTLSPVAWNPGYLFHQYLAWPMQQLGIQGCLVDGDSFGWSGAASHQVAQIPFQQSFKIAVRDTGWSHAFESLEALASGMSPTDLARRWVADLSKCKESPVILAVEVSKWVGHPALAGAMLSFIQQVFNLGKKAGIEWSNPERVLREHQAKADFPAMDWVVDPHHRALMGNIDHHPLAAEMISRWREAKAKGLELSPSLIDAQHLVAVDDPESWLGEGLGKAGQVYGRVMRQMASKWVD